jgi:hypothetical protein
VGAGLGVPLLAPQHGHQAHQAGSPVKESSFLNRETSAEDVQGGGEQSGQQDREQSGAIPIRR